jgi:hypothetical protein
MTLGGTVSTACRQDQRGPVPEPAYCLKTWPAGDTCCHGVLSRNAQRSLKLPKIGRESCELPHGSLLHGLPSSSSWLIYALALCSSAPASDNDRSARIPSRSADCRPDRSRRIGGLADPQAALTSGTLVLVSFPSIRMVVTLSPSSVLTRIVNGGSLLSGARNLQIDAERYCKVHAGIAGMGEAS